MRSLRERASPDHNVPFVIIYVKDDDKGKVNELVRPEVQENIHMEFCQGSFQKVYQ